MPTDLTALKREKIDREVSTGLVQTRGEDLVRKSSGSQSTSKLPTKSLPLEPGKGSKK